MKKIVYLFAIVATFALASCGGKATTESEAVTAENADSAATALVEELNANLSNPEAINAAVKNAAETIKELEATDPEAAKAYKWKLQEFYEKNKENLTVSGAIESFGNIDGLINEVKEAAKADANTAAAEGQEAAKAAIENNEDVKDAKAKVEQAQKDAETVKKASEDIKSGIDALKGLKK